MTPVTSDRASAGLSRDDFSYYSRLAGRRFGTVVGVAVLIGAITVIGYSRQPKEYRSTAVMQVGGQNDQRLSGTQARVSKDIADRDVQNQISVIHSGPMAQRTAEALGNVSAGQILERIEVVQIEGTDMVHLTAVSDVPEVAQRLAQAHLDAYLKFRRERFEEGSAIVRGRFEARLAQLKDEIAARDAELARVRSPKDGEELRVAQAAAADEYEVLASRVAELNLGVKLPDGIEVISPANLPAVRSGPGILERGVLAVGVGVVIGAGIMLVRDHVDNLVRSAPDAARASGLPVLAEIPRARRLKRQVGIVSATRPEGRHAVAFRSLMNRIELSRAQRRLDTILVCCPEAQPGRAMVAANLATVFA
jgi:capsular polysaccharide biosynthesis protein